MENNPSNMTNDDLEKDMQQLNKETKDSKKNEENVNKSTAAEGTLMTPKEDPHHLPSADYVGDEKDLDDVVHKPVDNGTVPDAEQLSLNEEQDGYDDPNKISS